MNSPTDSHEKKQAALPGAARATQTSKGDDTASAAGEQPFAVLCCKSGGARVVFQRYASRSEADQVAARLQQLGCRAEVRS